MTETVTNTDREIWRETEGDYYAPSIHATELGGIGINVGGMVHVLPVREWHKLALRQSDTRIEGGGAKVRPIDTAPSGEDAMEPSEIDVHEGAWALIIGTNGKPAGWVDTHALFAHQLYCDQILPLNKSPTPEHVEGGVLSVGEMATDDVFDWLKTELSAIDIRYRGDPSYDHDAYWFRDRVENLFDDARKAFPEISSAQSIIRRAERERDEAVQNAEIVCNSYADENQRLHDRATTAEAQLADAVKVLNGMLAIVGDSRGVDGYHRNGDVAEWDEFPEIEDARTFLSTIGEKQE